MKSQISRLKACQAARGCLDFGPRRKISDNFRRRCRPGGRDRRLAMIRIITGTRGRMTVSAMAMAAGLAATTLAGCGSSSSSSGGTSSLSGQTLTVYTQAPYGTQLKQYQEYYAWIADAFH